MKLTAIFLLPAFLTASANGFGQTISLSETNATLTNVFQKIEKQSGYTFYYKVELLQNAKPVDISVKDVTLDQALQLLFKDQPLTYKIVSKNIVVNEKPVTQSFIEIIQLPPPIDIQGRVVNNNGEPVAGASIKVKGTNKGTSTNDKGEFTLTGIDANAILVISGINIETVELNVSGKKELTITAKIKVAEGENVQVVSTGFQDIPKERATGSFVKVSNEQFNRRVSPDFLSRLTGSTSSFLADRTADNALGISIRGRSTIFANTQPLIIVDNFPFAGDINSINPNDIESITILKDAAAASIWGARSGNGVIVITTKKSKYNQKAVVEFNSSITISGKPDLFHNKSFLNSSDFIDVEKFLFDKGHYDGYLQNNIEWPAVSPVVEILDQLRSGSINQTDADKRINALRGMDVRNEQSKYFYQRSIHQQYAINLRTGNERFSNYFSVGYDKSRANLIGDEYNRFTTNFMTTYKPFEKVELSGGIVYAQGSNRNNSFSGYSAGSYGTFYPYAQFADADGNPLSIIKNYRDTFAKDPLVPGMLDWQYYPLNEIRLNNNRTTNYDTRLIAGIKYSVIKGLSLELKYQFQKSIFDRKDHYDQDLYFTRDLINQFTQVSGSTLVSRPVPLGDIIILGNNSSRTQNFRGQFNYNTKWRKHSIAAIAGMEVTETKADGNQSWTYGYDNNTGSSRPVNFDVEYTLYPSTLTSRIPGAPYLVPSTLNRFRAYFMNASYTYNERYTISGSARVDQSNLFGVKTNQKSIPLWSAGVKWDIDKEDFYKISWLSFLKLRATYGYNGNIDNTLSALPAAIVANGDLVNNGPYAYIISPGNPELRWEKIGELNVGIDFQLKNNRVSGSIEYFHKTGKDMIGDAFVPSSTGYTFLRGNFSNMKGNGFDVTLNLQNIDRKVKWTTRCYLSMATDKVTKNAGTPTTSNIILVGRPVRGIYSYRWGGLDANGNPLGYLGDTITTSYSEIISRAQADPTKFIFNGQAAPKFHGSLINTFSYKSLSLSINIVFKSGYYFNRGSISYSSLFNSWVGHEDFLNRWQKAGDEAFTDVPAMIYPNNAQRDNFYTNSTVLIEKGDHIRLQDISLSYVLSRKKDSKLPFENIEIYAYANNLGILWRANKHGIDPDYRVSPYPAPKTISIGIKTNL